MPDSSESFPPPDTRPIGGTLMEMRHVTLRFGGAEALRDISFDAHEREIRAIVTPNGTGRSAPHTPLARATSPGRARPSPREGALQRHRIERRREAWHHKPPTSAVAPAPSQARARPSAPGAALFHTGTVGVAQSRHRFGMERLPMTAASVLAPDTRPIGAPPMERPHITLRSRGITPLSTGIRQRDTRAPTRPNGAAEQRPAIESPHRGMNPDPARRPRPRRVVVPSSAVPGGGLRDHGRRRSGVRRRRVSA